jgi:cytochrome b561
MTNANPGKIGLLRLHMAAGIVLLVLMLVRLIVRWSTRRPAAATTGSPLLDRIAVLVHYSFYVVVIVMAASGLTTAVVSGLNLIVFGNSAAPLPDSLMRFLSFRIHYYTAWAFVILIAVHILAALYHQMLLHDGLFLRMWFSRTSPSATPARELR